MRPVTIFLMAPLALALLFGPAGMAGAETPAVPAEAPAESAAEPSGLSDFTRQSFMSLKEARKLGMSNNIDVMNARRDLDLAILEITRAKSGYDPYVQIDANYQKSQQAQSQSVFGTESETSTWNFSSGVNTPTGGSMSVDFKNTRQESDSYFSTLNPSYDTDLSLNVKQPLLKNAYRDAREMDLDQTKNDYHRTKLALESKSLEVESQIEDAYWNLVRSGLDLDLKRKSLALSERMDVITKAQVDAGTQPRVATLQTEANVASARASLIRSENEYRKNQATLKIVLNLEYADLWALEIVPTDLPEYESYDLDRDAVMNEALANNFGIRQTRLQIRNAEISNEQARNKTLPQLDLRGSVSVSGLAGTSKPQDQVVQTGFVIPNPNPTDEFPAPYMLETMIVPGQESEFEGGYEDALDRMFQGDDMSWSTGVTFNMPVGNRAAKADLRRSLINYEKLNADLNNLKREAYFNLINLMYDLEASRRSYIAAREARRLQEQNLATEEKKYKLGMNTSYEVLQAEESYSDARGAEIGALIDYAKSRGKMERARKGYLSGSAASLSSASSLSSMGSLGTSSSAIDASALDSLSGSLPAGFDASAYGISLP